MAHPWKGRFTPKICKKWHWKMMILSASKKSWNIKEIKSWCVGKVGQISTTPGSTKVLWRNDGVLRTSRERSGKAMPVPRSFRTMLLTRIVCLTCWCSENSDGKWNWAVYHITDVQQDRLIGVQSKTAEIDESVLVSIHLVWGIHWRFQAWFRTFCGKLWLWPSSSVRKFAKFG